MSKNLSRRQFIKGAAYSAAGLAAASVLGPNAAIAENAQPGIQWDYEADVVVIGAGGAGLPAALKAMEDSRRFNEEELKASKKVLGAAALTYVAALATSLAQILRLLVIAGGSRNRRD